MIHRHLEERTFSKDSRCNKAGLFMVYSRLSIENVELNSRSDLDRVFILSWEGHVLERIVTCISYIQIVKTRIEVGAMNEFACRKVVLTHPNVSFNSLQDTNPIFSIRVRDLTRDELQYHEAHSMRQGLISPVDMSHKINSPNTGQYPGTSHAFSTCLMLRLKLK